MNARHTRKKKLSNHKLEVIHRAILSPKRTLMGGGVNEPLLEATLVYANDHNIHYNENASSTTLSSAPSSAAATALSTTPAAAPSSALGLPIAPASTIVIRKMNVDVVYKKLKDFNEVYKISRKTIKNADFYGLKSEANRNINVFNTNHKNIIDYYNELLGNSTNTKYVSLQKQNIVDFQNDTLNKVFTELNILFKLSYKINVLAYILYRYTLYKKFGFWKEPGTITVDTTYNTIYESIKELMSYSNKLLFSNGFKKLNEIIQKSVNATFNNEAKLQNIIKEISRKDGILKQLQDAKNKIKTKLQAINDQSKSKLNDYELKTDFNDVKTVIATSNITVKGAVDQIKTALLDKLEKDGPTYTTPANIDSALEITDPKTNEYDQYKTKLPRYAALKALTEYTTSLLDTVNGGGLGNSSEYKLLKDGMNDATENKRLKYVFPFLLEVYNSLYDDKNYSRSTIVDDKTIPNSVIMEFVITNIRSIEQQYHHPDLLRTVYYFWNMFNLPIALSYFSKYVSEKIPAINAATGTTGAPIISNKIPGIKTYFDRNLSKVSTYEEWDKIADDKKTPSDYNVYAVFNDTSDPILQGDNVILSTGSYVNQPYVPLLQRKDMRATFDPANPVLKIAP